MLIVFRNNYFKHKSLLLILFKQPLKGDLLSSFPKPLLWNYLILILISESIGLILFLGILVSTIFLFLTASKLIKIMIKKLWTYRQSYKNEYIYFL